METKKIEVKFGWLAPTIAMQLRKQKLKFNKEKVRDFQKNKDRILILEMEGILNEKATDRAIKKLSTKVMAHVRKSNKLKLVRNGIK